MTDSDRPAFAQAYARLALAHRDKTSDAAQLRVYFEALRDVDIEFIVLAAESLLGAEFFPKVGEWRRAAQRVERARLEAQRQLLRNLPAPLCLACADTGWARDAEDRVRRCDCQTRRRLEVLGRRPWPALPAAAAPDPDAVERVDQMIATLARDKTIRPLSPVERVDEDEETDRVR